MFGPCGARVIADDVLIGATALPCAKPVWIGYCAHQKRACAFGLPKLAVFFRPVDEDQKLPSGKTGLRCFGFAAAWSWDQQTVTGNSRSRAHIAARRFVQFSAPRTLPLSIALLWRGIRRARRMRT